MKYKIKITTSLKDIDYIEHYNCGLINHGTIVSVRGVVYDLKSYRLYLVKTNW